MFKIKRHKPGRERRRPEKQRQGIERYLHDDLSMTLEKEGPTTMSDSPIVDLDEATMEKLPINLIHAPGQKVTAWVAVVVLEDANGRQGVSVQYPGSATPYQVQDVLDAGDHFMKQQIRYRKPEQESKLIVHPGNVVLPPFPGGRA